MDYVVNKSKMEIMVRDFSVLSTVDVSFYPGWRNEPDERI